MGRFSEFLPTFIHKNPWPLVLTLIQGEEQDVEAQAGQQGTQRCLPPTTQRVLVTEDSCPSSQEGETGTQAGLQNQEEEEALELRGSGRNEKWVSHLDRRLGEELRPHFRPWGEKGHPLRTRRPVEPFPRRRKNL